MKILQINKFYYRRRGAETYLFDLIDLLQQHGHDVAVFAMDHPKNEASPYSEYFVSNVDYDALQLSAKLKAARRLLWSREAQQQLEKLLQKFQPDVAHIHNIYHQISPSILVTLKRHGIPIVQTLHDYKLICPNYELYTQGNVCERCRGHRYYNAVTHRCLKNSTAASALAMAEMYAHKWRGVYEKNVDCFISPSQFLKEKIMEWGEAVRRIEVVPNFISAATIPPTEHYEPYFLYAGAISEIKGVRLLLDNFQKNHYDFSLRLAGDGPLLSELRAQVKNSVAKSNIEFLGLLPKAELYTQLASAYAIIVPSRHYENFPYSILEAFAHGKPVIASQRGGILELINDQTGWLFNPDQPATLDSAIRAAIIYPEEVRRRGQIARRLIEQHLDPQTHYERIFEIYQSVCSA